MAISFDGPNKLVILSIGTTSLDVRVMWSEWVNWLLSGDNSKYLFAMSNIGGDDISVADGTKIPIFVFLQNGWRIHPQEAHHTLAVKNGILIVAEGGDPFIDTTGAFIVRINYQQPVQAISFSSEGGTVDIDAIAAAVWNAILTGHITVGTAGRVVQDIRNIASDNQALILAQ